MKGKAQAISRPGKMLRCVIGGCYDWKRQRQERQLKKRRAPFGNEYSVNEHLIRDIHRVVDHPMWGIGGWERGKVTISWFLYWRIHLDMKNREPWSPFTRWAQLIAVEDTHWSNPAQPVHPNQPEVGGDPTPYPSPQEALAQAPLLPFETNAAICPSVFVLPYCDPDSLDGLDVRMPTRIRRCPGVTDETLDEYTLQCLRYYASYKPIAPDAPGLVRDGVGWQSLVWRMGEGVGFYDWEAIQASVARLLQRGAIEWEMRRRGVYVPAPTPKRWWTEWHHYKHSETDTPLRLDVKIRELIASEAPRPWKNQHPERHGWDGPFDTEKEAREKVSAYSLLHGIPVGSVDTSPIQLSGESKSEWGDAPPEKGCPSDKRFPMKQAK